MGAGQQPRRVELHHLHVAEGKPGAERHGQPVGALVARRRVVAVHGRPAAGGQQHRPGLDEDETAGAHVDHQHARDGAAVPACDQFDGAVVLQAADAPVPDLLRQPVDDLDAGQVALVHRAVEGLPGEGLLMQGAVLVTVEEAAEFVLEFADAFLGARHQQPGQVLVVQPLAAFDGVHEVAFDGIAGRQGDVVAALDHAGAAAFAQQSLDRDGDGKIGPGLGGMERREQPGAARAQNQDVGPDRLRGLQTSTPMRASAPARRSRARSWTAPYKLPP